MPHTKEQIDAQFKKLPPTLRTAMFSVEVSEAIYDIGRSHGLTIEEIGFMAEEIGYALLGLLPPQKFVATLESRLDIDEDEARDIASAINHRIFFPIRRELKETHELDFGEAEIQKSESRSANYEAGEGEKGANPPSSLPSAAVGSGDSRQMPPGPKREPASAIRPKIQELPPNPPIDLTPIAPRPKTEPAPLFAQLAPEVAATLAPRTTIDLRKPSPAPPVPPATSSPTPRPASAPPSAASQTSQPPSFSNPPEPAARSAPAPFPAAPQSPSSAPASVQKPAVKPAPPPAPYEKTAEGAVVYKNKDPYRESIE